MFLSSAVRERAILEPCATASQPMDATWLRPAMESGGIADCNRFKAAIPCPKTRLDWLGSLSFGSRATAATGSGHRRGRRSEGCCTFHTGLSSRSVREAR